MSNPVDMEFRHALTGFVGAFEIVFHYDWAYTREMIGDEVKGANFIEPGLDDETEDWGARGALLEKYRQLIKVMQNCGMEPVFPFPLERVTDQKRVW